MLSNSFLLLPLIFILGSIQNTTCLYNRISSFFTNMKKISQTQSQEQILQIGFLRGSKIENSFYNRFLNTLEETSNTDIKLNVTYLTYNPIQYVKKDTIIIGHSFGGYMGLMYCIKEKHQRMYPYKQSF